MFFVYQILITLVVILSPLIIFFRILKKKEDKKRFKEKFCIFSKKRGPGKLIWFHGASVGEILTIIPLINKYEQDKSISKILVTSNTLSSSLVIKKFKFKKLIHQFFPIDHVYFVSKFLKYWKPHLAIFIDSEVWPNMTYVLENKNIPLILLNARITKKSFDKWIKFKNSSRSLFKKITIAYPQNRDTKKILKNLDVNRIKEIGNLKIVENNKEKHDNIGLNLNKQFKRYKTWVAASTHSDEEIFCAKTHIKLKKSYKNLITIIIPRHIHRVDEIISKLKNLNLNIVTHSSKIKNLNDVDIYIVDTFGDSKKFFKISNTVFMGGTLVSRGGQNPLEAARYGNKILHGPHIENFKDIFLLLKSLKISKEIRSVENLTSAIIFYKNIKRANKIKKIGQLILKRTIKELKFFIKNEPKKT
ncbi:3-deoxy-D-manno-octulosonic acid transferase [Candidatus Pelagibacter sp.]|nr:3-deoxy-D-manno-octulosonic acid transferase [Candidatus Pelagibacter sp.]